MDSALKASAARLPHRAILQRWIEGTPDSRGQPTGTWQSVGAVFVRIEPMGPRLLELAHQQWEAATHRVTMRYHADVGRKGWRLLYQGRPLAIGHVQNVDEANHTLILMASESV